MRWFSRGSVLLALAACTRGEPPAPAGIDASVAPLPPPSTAAAVAPPPASPSASASASTSAGSEPGELPQTRDRPKAEGAAFDARAAALWDGIVHDDPKRAMPFFFPLAAYKQVKDVGSPAGDWRLRLVANYERDIHALHADLGKSAERARLVRVEVPDARAKWIEPGEEYNKIGYYRVYGTRIVYTVGDGTRERTIPVSSLISWRGEWYVVHLTGFK